jgi:hypothetical protein
MMKFNLRKCVRVYRGEQGGRCVGEIMGRKRIVFGCGVSEGCLYFCLSIFLACLYILVSMFLCDDVLNDTI